MFRIVILVEAEVESTKRVKAQEQHDKRVPKTRVVTQKPPRRARTRCNTLPALMLLSRAVLSSALRNIVSMNNTSKPTQTTGHTFGDPGR